MRLFGSRSRVQPSAIAIDPTGLSPNQLSEPHLLLLSRYCFPQNWRTGSGYGWDKVLGEPPEAAIRRFLSEGLLVPSPPRSKLETFSVKDLKVFLKERQLPVSGNKEVLIDRLVQASDSTLAAKLEQFDIVECSPQARDLTSKYLDQKRVEKRATVTECLACLRNEDFAGACREVAQYEARQVFPRGVGVDWSKPGEVEARRLKILFYARPKILADLPANDWKSLRVAAGMMLLWGLKTASDWLPDGFVGVSKFDSDTAARMLVFHVNFVVNMTDYREMGVRTATISACEDSCEACHALNGKQLLLDEVPELPFYACTHAMGCRCLLLPDTPASFSE